METSAIIIKHCTLSKILGFALCSSNNLTISSCPPLDANNKAGSPYYETNNNQHQ